MTVSHVGSTRERANSCAKTRQGSLSEQVVFELEREDERLCRQEGNIFSDKEGGLAGRGRPGCLKR